MTKWNAFQEFNVGLIFKNQSCPGRCLSCLECHPVHQKVADSNPSQVTYLAFGFYPACMGGNRWMALSHTDVSLSPFHSLPPSLSPSLTLKVSKHILGWGLTKNQSWGHSIMWNKWNSQSQKDKTAWFHLYQVSTVVKIRKAESRKVVTRDWGEKEMGSLLFNGYRVSVMQEKKF